MYVSILLISEHMFVYQSSLQRKGLESWDSRVTGWLGGFEWSRSYQ